MKPSQKWKPFWARTWAVVCHWTLRSPLRPSLLICETRYLPEISFCKWVNNESGASWPRSAHRRCSSTTFLLIPCHTRCRIFLYSPLLMQEAGFQVSPPRKTIGLGKLLYHGQVRARQADWLCCCRWWRCLRYRARCLGFLKCKMGCPVVCTSWK